MRYSPEGRTLARNGVPRESASKRSRSRAAPARPAIAIRCTIALVEPPRAMATVTAFSKASVVRMSRGFRSSQTISTIRRPLADARRGWRESAAGMDDPPGSIIPSASAAAAMVEAVPMVMQVPNERAMPSSISFQAQSSSVPARFSAQYFQTSLPLPSTWPRQLPRSMGPAETKIAGRFMLVAPISSAGTVLSQPPSSTAPSIGLARRISSASMANRFRYSIVVGFMYVSPTDSTGISSGKPPACHTPRFTSSARMRKWVWHELASLQVLRMAMTGRSPYSSGENPACFVRDRWPKERTVSPPNHRRLRRSAGVLRARFMSARLCRGSARRRPAARSAAGSRPAARAAAIPAGSPGSRPAARSAGWRRCPPT